MGAQIAAHCTNARIPVVLFDLAAKEGPKNGIVLRAMDALKKQSPAPLADKDDAAFIEPANYDDNLDLLEGCDLVIEAISERLDWKLDLYRKVAAHVAPHAIFASNTSGLSITKLSEGVGPELLPRFCGIHFFNPPRYMHLVELIPTRATRPDLLDGLEEFLVSVLGKGVIRALDTPNFIANRVGTFGILATIAEAERFGLTFDVVDDLTGSKLGRAKSGTFRTADVVGLDTLGHVIKTMQDQLKDDPFHAAYATPKILGQLVERGALGQKTGAGFYKKAGSNILRLDPQKGDYVPSGAKADDAVSGILKNKNPAERLRLLRESSSPQAQFLWAIFRDTFHYSAVHLATIAESARDVDFALRWGFGWSTGPFESWQAAGWAEVAGFVRDDVAAGKALSTAPLPAWVFEGKAAKGVHTSAGSYSPQKNAFLPRRDLPILRRQVFRATLHGEGVPGPDKAGRTLAEDESMRLFTLDEEVLILSIKTRMRVIGPGVITGLVRAVDEAEKNYQGVVIWSPDEPFSAGADLKGMMPLFSEGPSAIEAEEKRMQESMLRLRYARIPTVAALSGLALGGGCELAVACAKRVAHLETYIGLVEVGVGLVPGSGGLLYAARRAAEEHALAPDAPLLHFLKRYFTNVAMANVSKSAYEAQQMGYLLRSDPVIFNVHELLGAAVREAKTMFEASYRAPFRTKGFPVAGRSGAATILGQLTNLREGGYISEHDLFLGKTVADVVCGGDVEAGSLVDEAWILGLERKAFLGLLGHPKTQERIVGMMQDGKPVRN
jgi:3-hydroxyacyl-CoA dehydrogenase